MNFSSEEVHSSLLLDLYEAGWKGPDFSPFSNHRQRAMTELERSLFKKFHNEQTDSNRDSKALSLFLQCNSRCQNFAGVIPRRLNEELIINEMKLIIYDFFNPCFRGSEKESFREPMLLNLTDIAKRFCLGSGSNIGADSTDFYTKLANSSMCSTDAILPILYKQAISNDKLWSDVEKFRSDRFETEIVRGSRLSFVPKSRDISRTICTEPVLNMLFQRGIGVIMEERLREVFQIDLSTQPFKNAALARIGSLDGRYGTIDLSSASDSISNNLIRDIVPLEPRNWLNRVRSPSTTIPSGEVVDLHMISSMGNGFTFPLQTMIFASLVMAAYKVYGVKPERPYADKIGNYAIFGDDIIVHHSVYNVVVSCLEVLGFSVNHDKSFSEGLFRESCGSDFFSGHNVRGVYIKKMLSAGDYYSAINRLNRWSSRHGIFLLRTISLLRRGCRFSGVPFAEADDSGLKVPLSLLRTYRRDINGAIKYRALVNVPRFVRISSVEAELELSQNDALKVRRLLTSFQYSSDGLMLALLAGYLRNGCLGLRSLSPKAVLRKRVSPGWDPHVSGPGESPDYCERWKLFTVANLVGSHF